ncbi:MAG TPA: MEDS domain-containing protein [Vicinamibacterales bacterium]|nr:MEDS domain-containing protein [Vicinamibacterales bacterium]
MTEAHFLQLFDTIESRADNVGAFVEGSLAAGGKVVVLATPEHWKAVDERLSLWGCDVDSAIADRRLTMVDARRALESILRRGQPDPMRFSAWAARAVPPPGGSVVRRIFVYGELVDLLAEEANFAAAVTLERLWSDLLKSRPFTLMCGYCSAHFSNPRAGSALREICACHSRNETASDDALGSFLITSSRRRR